MSRSLPTLITTPMESQPWQVKGLIITGQHSPNQGDTSSKPRKMKLKISAHLLKHTCN